MQNKQDFSTLYSILYQTEFWYNTRNVRNNKIDAIKKIGVNGELQGIYHLIGFLSHTSVKVRSVTIQSIASLFDRFGTNIHLEQSICNYPIKMKNVKIYHKNYNGQELIYPLAIASMNRDGYVRELALKHIFEYHLGESLLRFVIYRLGDWVPQVRILAKKVFYQVLEKGNWQIFMKHLDDIFRMRRIQRTDLSKMYEDAIQFLIIEKSQETYAEFPNLSEKNRFSLSLEILKNDPIQKEAIDMLCTDTSYLVRSKLAENVHRIEYPNKVIAVFEMDKSSIVREKCLASRMKIDTELATIDFKSLLTDKSATIRNLARFHLKDSEIDFARHYRMSVSKLDMTESSIYGLGEVGNREDVDALLGYLNSDSNKLKKAAIRTILKLDGTRISDALVNELDSKIKSIRMLAIDHLSKFSKEEIIERCRQIYESGNNDLKISMLSFFGKVGSFKSLPDLIKGLNDEDTIITNAAWSHLQNWRKNAISIFIEPTELDKQRARAEYERVKFNSELSMAKEELWKSLPYFGRFKT